MGDFCFKSLDFFYHDFDGEKKMTIGEYNIVAR